ncbi:MAG: alcohol dehydrogenase [Rickettsiales bacterium]|nr:alcohol dehydrogenase [Rickettsiales bacterium]|tara:strand:+ start:884 stop:1954 length:1071 start_codon:yes stop_codon:yes gene_type:complete
MMQLLSIELAEYVCERTATMRDVLTRIGESPHLFQIIIDKEGRLLGTVTDGDIRRAMLEEVGLDAPVEACMQIDPVTGMVGQDEENRRKLQSIGSSRAFLPVVDRDGSLMQIFVLQRPRNFGIGCALVMAGGFGRRLGLKTENTPKPLLQVGGQPILERVVSQLEDAGIGKIFISAHYLADQIQNFVDTRENRALVNILTEDEPRGTAGALGDLPVQIDTPVLVINGDVLTKIDFSKLHDFHFRHGHDGTIAVARHDIEIPYGVVQFGEDGLFAGINEKPRLSNFIAAGLYFLAPEFLSLVPKNQRFDMPELLNLGRTMGLKIGLFPIHEYWIDVGRPSDLATADSDFGDRSGDTG